jgi:hypothetical protein
METPYRVYDVLTGEELGRYSSYNSAAVAHEGQPIEIIYRPSRRKKVKK